MNVQNPVGKRLDEDRAEQPHEPREADQLDTVRSKLGHERAVVVLPAGIRAVVDDAGLQACRSRAIQPSGTCPVGDHDGDGRVEPSVCNRVDNGLKVRAAAREQNTDAIASSRSGARGHATEDSAMLVADRNDSATNVSVPFVQPPVGSVGAPITNKF